MCTPQTRSSFSLCNLCPILEVHHFPAFLTHFWQYIHPWTIQSIVCHVLEHKINVHLASSWEKIIILNVIGFFFKEIDREVGYKVIHLLDWKGGIVVNQNSWFPMLPKWLEHGQLGGPLWLLLLFQLPETEPKRTGLLNHLLLLLMQLCWLRTKAWSLLNPRIAVAVKNITRNRDQKTKKQTNKK